MFRAASVTESRGDAAAPPSRPVLVGDRYELGEELGRGAFGLVYKGTDIKTGEVVAIKEISLSGMSPDRLKDIMLEIDLLKNLNHENIVQYIGFYKTRSHLSIILEYMEQGALSLLIKKDRWGVLPEPVIAGFVQQVLTGLKYLHEQGVVHRDIKGANILLGAEVCPVLPSHSTVQSSQHPSAPGFRRLGRLQLGQVLCRGKSSWQTSVWQHRASPRTGTRLTRSEPPTGWRPRSSR